MEIRKQEDGSIVLEGYVNAVCRDSRTLYDTKYGQFVEQIDTGVWNRALENAEDVRVLFNHNSVRDLGGIKEGNLELFEDSIGLRVKATISDDEVITKAEKGLLTGWSFGFRALKDKWEDTKSNIKRRFVEELQLFEVSILDKTPAYFGTLAEVRGETEVEIRDNVQVEEQKDVEIQENNTEEEVREIPNFDLLKTQIYLLKNKR